MIEAAPDITIESIEPRGLGPWAVLTRPELQFLLDAALRERDQRPVIEAARAYVDTENRWVRAELNWSQWGALDNASNALRVAVEKLDSE